MPTETDLTGLGMSPFLATELGNTQKALTAAGTTAGAATAILTKLSLVNGQASQTGVILPSGAKIGSPFYIVGTGANAPVVYPPTGSTINGASSLTLSAATATAILMRTGTTTFVSFPLAP